MYCFTMLPCLTYTAAHYFNSTVYDEDYSFVQKVVLKEMSKLGNIKTAKNNSFPVAQQWDFIFPALFYMRKWPG